MRNTFLMLGSCLAGLVAADPALAQQTENSASVPAVLDQPGQEILVTARRREESSQDVPIAITVLSGNVLEQTGSLTLSDIKQLIPSLQVRVGNARNSSINIRGLGANSASASDGLEQGVGFYVDGVYYARPGQAQFDLVDLQQMEVLRGPQGTLFGKNTTAGAINITTRLPSFEPEVRADATLGNYGYHQVRVSGSFPLIADRVAMRLSIADTHRDGFLTNLFDGSDAQDYDNFTARAQLLVKPTENVTVRVIGDYSNQKQHFALTIPAGYFTTYANGAAIPNNFLVRAARNNYTPLPADAFAREGDSNSPFQSNMRSYGVSGEVNWNLGWSTLTSITAYRWWGFDPKNDGDGTPLSSNVIGQASNRQRQFSQELRIASNGENTISYVAGLFYFQQVVRQNGALGYGPDYAAWNLDPATSSAATIALTDYALNGFRSDIYSDPRTKSYAAFGQADWRVSDRLTVTGGLRFTHEDKHGEYRQWWAAGNDLSLLTPAQRIQATAIRNAPNREFSFTAQTKSSAVSGLLTLRDKFGQRKVFGLEKLNVRNRERKFCS